MKGLGIAGLQSSRTDYTVDLGIGDFPEDNSQGGKKKAKEGDNHRLLFLKS